MMNNSIRITSLLISALFGTFCIQAQQQTYDLYYLCIGSVYYDKTPSHLETGFKGLFDVQGAGHSARKMASLLDNFGAREGDTLISKEYQYLSSKEILKAVKKIIQKAKRDKAHRPLLVFYYCGHGFSSGLHEDHFIVPGTMTHNYQNFEYEDWGKHLLPSLMIRELLDDSDLPYFMLLDCCYEGKQNAVERITNEMATLFGLQTYQTMEGQVYKILLAMNRMVGPNPVVFSTTAGESVPTVSYTSANGQTEWIGPLCFRTLAFLEALEAPNTPFVLNEWVKALVDPSLAAQPTTQGYTYYYPEESAPIHFIRKP